MEDREDAMREMVENVVALRVYEEDLALEFDSKAYELNRQYHRETESLKRRVDTLEKHFDNFVEDVRSENRLRAMELRKSKRTELEARKFNCYLIASLRSNIYGNYIRNSHDSLSIESCPP